MKVVIQYGALLIDARIEMRDGGETMVVVPVAPLAGGGVTDKEEGGGK